MSWSRIPVPAGLLVWLVACGTDPSAPPSARLMITLTLTGEDLDVDGAVVTVDARTPVRISANGTVTIAVGVGAHSLEIDGLTTNCTPERSRQDVEVAAERTVDVVFSATCTATTGLIEVSVTTVGRDPDSNGYLVMLDGGGQSDEWVSSDSADRVVLGPVWPGSHTIGVSDLAANCAVAGPNPITGVQVTAGGVVRDTVRVQVGVVCTSTRGALLVVTSSSGDPPDPDGYTISVGPAPGLTVALGRTDSTVIADLPAGPHPIALRDLAGNCQLVGPVATWVTIVAMDTATVRYTIECVTPAVLRVTAPTSGPAPEAGYLVTVDAALSRDLSRPLLANDTLTLGLIPGAHAIGLTEVAANCIVAGPNPGVVYVSTTAPTDLVFMVTCVPGGSNTHLVFGSFSDLQIYTVGLSGGGRTRLTSEGQNGRPVWSPDGRRIAFGRYDGGSDDLYVMDADGTNVARRTVGLGVRAATWSPDGRQLAVSSEGLYYSDIWIISAQDDGGAPIHLATDARSPAWSPDGKKIAYIHVSGDDGYDALDVMNADGTGATSLTPPWGGRYGPTWSPDGSHIASSLCDAGLCDLIVMKADGSDERRLTDVGTVSWGGAWSPDGRWIAVTLWLWPSVGPSVAVVPAEGGTPVTITDDGFAPSWGP
jgi:Tol biopolymer transport system component